MNTTATAVPAAVAALFEPARVDAIVKLRRALHQHPELSFHEEQTAARLEAALAEFGVREVARVAGTGIVARIPGRDRQAPVVAVRGDTDALPIQEETGLPFASSVPNVMHACGHDVHASWAAAAAGLLVSHPGDGDVLIVLQPAEETGRGALAILESGALDDARAIFGAHVDRRFDVGQVVADAGALAASADTFTIELSGSGAHAARPHEAADPIVAAGAVIGALQTLVSRRLNPAWPGVVTIGSIHAGDAPNVIPDRALLGGTIRATEAPARALLLEQLRATAEGVAAAYGVRARVTFELGTPPLVNPPEAAAWARQAAAAVLGDSALVPLGFLNMAGEDFAHYLERIPGCFLRIGAREPGGDTIAAHSPRFYPSEESLFVGAAVLAECARVASASLRHGA
jgi:hippurate hydrolase